MSGIPSQTRGDPPRPEFSPLSPAMQLLSESRAGGALDVWALADGVSRLSQLDPRGALQVLEELADVLPPLDLGRVTSHVIGAATAAGDVVEHLVQRGLSDLSPGPGRGLGAVLDGAIDTLTRTTAPVSPDLSRRIDAMGSGLARPSETGWAQGWRTEQIGGGEAVGRASGQVMPLGGPQTPAEVQSVGVTRASTEATGGLERTAAIGRNEAVWPLDAQGRPVRAEAILREVFADLERSSAETRAQGEAADMGVEGDHGGHIIGHRFVKDQGLDNLFPPNGDFNISAYKTLENEMADWVEAGAEVRVTVDLLGGGDRPVRVRVAYEVLSAASGDVVYENNVLFRHEADQTFDRTPSSDLKTTLDG